MNRDIAGHRLLDAVTRHGLRNKSCCVRCCTVSAMRCRCFNPPGEDEAEREHEDNADKQLGHAPELGAAWPLSIPSDT